MAVYAPRSLRVSPTAATFAGVPWVGFDAALACSGPGTWVSRHIVDADVRLRALIAGGSYSQLQGKF